MIEAAGWGHMPPVQSSKKQDWKKNFFWAPVLKIDDMCLHHIFFLLHCFTFEQQTNKWQMFLLQICITTIFHLHATDFFVHLLYLEVEKQSHVC